VRSPSQLQSSSYWSLISHSLALWRLKANLFEKLWVLSIRSRRFAPVNFRCYFGNAEVAKVGWRLRHQSFGGAADWFDREAPASRHGKESQGEPRPAPKEEAREWSGLLRGLTARKLSRKPRGHRVVVTSASLREFLKGSREDSELGAG